MGEITAWLTGKAVPQLDASGIRQAMLECEFNHLSDERLWELLFLLLSFIEKSYCVVGALDGMEPIEKDGFSRPTQ